MKNDRSLNYLYAALGAITFFVAIVPILDSFSTWVSNIFGLQSVKLNAKATEISGGVSEESQGFTHAIGFQIPSEEDEVIEDE